MTSRRDLLAAGAGGLAALAGATRHGLADPARVSTLRLGFFPPVNDDIVYAVSNTTHRRTGPEEETARWQQRVTFTVTGPGAEPDLLTGVARIDAVTGDAASRDDPFRLMAQAIEGESFGVTFLQHGGPMEIDWLRVQPLLAARLPALTDPDKARILVAQLPAFGPDGITALLRPFWVASIAHLRAFPTDGTPARATLAQMPAWFRVENMDLEISGALLEGGVPGDVIVQWRATPTDAAAARAFVQSEIAETIARLQDRRLADNVLAEVDAALASGVELVEGGYAVWDPTPGLMREVELAARLAAGPILRETLVTMRRERPE